MESQCHKGSELKEIRGESNKCPTCGQLTEAPLTGYRCKVEGNLHSLDGVQLEFARGSGRAKLVLKEPGLDDMDKPQEATVLRSK